MTFWDEIVKEVGTQYPEIKTDLYHIDALAAYFLLKPEEFDVVAGGNLFGDILTDLGAALVGGLGLAPSGNINPEKEYPSMFEAIHGSAPDIAGKGIANPIAQIWSVSLMMDHLNQPELGKLILDGIEEVLVEAKVRTADLGGTASTAEMGDSIVSKIKELSGR
jgi:tartrate dehydrogenase/decarboxylase/D-malate dehydrogenase